HWDNSQASHGDSVQAPQPSGMPAPKLFVGQLPKEAGEAELCAVFEPYGRIVEFKILKFRDTGDSRGCGFITFADKASADAAMAALDKQHTWPGMRNPMTVAPAHTDRERQSRAPQPPPAQAYHHHGPGGFMGGPPPMDGGPAKLFVGMMPFSTTEQEMQGVFGVFGQIQNAVVLTKPDGSSKGCGFITFATQQAAMAAISAMNGSQTAFSPAGHRALTVKFADSPRDRDAR
ncbi:CELF4, partial [Symbiodinium sp. KB8]